MRVACCTVAIMFLNQLGIESGGHVLHVGSIVYSGRPADRNIADPVYENGKGAEEIYKLADESDVRCLDPHLSEQMREEIKIRRKEGTSLGGIYEIIVTGLPAGLGSYVHWDRKLDGQLAHDRKSVV